MKNSVLHITHTFPQTDARILKEALALSHEGFQITLIGISPGASNSHLHEQYTCLQFITPYSFFRLFKFLPSFLRHLLSFIEIYCKISFHLFTRRFSLIHCHDIWLLPLAVLYKLIYRVPLIYDSHELQSSANYTTFLQRFLIARFESFVWPFIDHLIVVSSSIKSWYLYMYGPKNTTIIYNSPPIPSSKPSSSYLRDCFSVPPSSKIFLYSGAFVNGRSIPHVLRIFSEMTDHHVVFVGDGHLKPLIQNYADQYSNIHIHPFVSHDILLNIISSADVGICLIENICLSYYYSLPNKLFEYCFAGLYILSSDFPDISRVLNTYSGSSVCNPTYESIKSSILSLISTNTPRVCPSNEFIFEYSWPSQSSKLISLYSQLLLSP